MLKNILNKNLDIANAITMTQMNAISAPHPAMGIVAQRVS